MAEPDLSKYYFRSPEKAVVRLPKGLSEKTVRDISAEKGEPDWMLKKRLDAYRLFLKLPMPSFGPDLSKLDFGEITYYIKPSERKARRWEDVPQHIKDAFEKLGVPEAERKFLAGVEAMFESEAVYQGLKKEWAEKGIIFTDTDSAVREYPEVVKKHFGTVVPSADNKFAALNTAAWSGGSFLLVPKGVKVEIPVQAYFRINAKAFGQFERTLIICEEGSKIHYTEGCFLKNTPVITKTGEKKIQDVQINDFVLTHRKRYKKVLQTQVRKYSGSIYSIRYYGDSLEAIQATEEHPLLAVKRRRPEYKNRDWKPGWVAASRLQKSDYLAIPINRSVNERAKRIFTVAAGRGRGGFVNKKMAIRTDADFFRIIGYYLAEGSSVNDHYLSFTFNKTETRYIQDVKRLLIRYFGKKPLLYREYKNGVSLVLCSTPAARFFRMHFGKRAEGKCLPEWAMQESSLKQRELVKGYWRGDGSFTDKKYPWGQKRAFRMNTVSRLLAKQMRNMLLRLGVFASINVWNKREGRKNSYCLFVGGEFLDRFSKIVDFQNSENPRAAEYAGASLHGNASFAKITREYAFVPIRKISSTYHKRADVYNFSVEDDESYIASGVAVHNCTAPIYTEASLHAAVVECIAKKRAHLRYTTVQNWSTNVYNLVTKRAFAYENALVEWVDGNVGSGINMKYPAVYLKGRNARAEFLSIAYAGQGQYQDAGARAIHEAEDTTSIINSRNISKNGGITSFRGAVRFSENAKNAKSSVKCDALLLDAASRNITRPLLRASQEHSTIVHEARVGRISEEKLFYLMSRGLSEAEATSLIVLGFVEQFVKELPLEYAVEFNRLVQMEMEKKVG